MFALGTIPALSPLTMETNNQANPPIILLVEDEESLRRSITFTLLRQGYCIVPYGSVDEALPYIEEITEKGQEIVLIISDLQLPGKNGLELVRRVRTDNPEIPILIITGHGNREVRRELELLGVTQVLDKPFDLEGLVTKVRLMIPKSERSR